MFISIKKNDEINEIIKTGVRCFSNDLILFYKKNSLNFCRVVVIASKKKFKLAVTRNKIKREIKAILINLKIYDHFLNFDFVFVIKSTYKIHNYDINRNNIMKLFRKIGG